MPESLTIFVGIAAILGTCLSIYTIIDSKIGNRRKELDTIKEKVADHESRIIANERITGVVEEYMEDLLLESLKRK